MDINATEAIALLKLQAALYAEAIGLSEQIAALQEEIEKTKQPKAAKDPVDKP